LVHKEIIMLRFFLSIAMMLLSFQALAQFSEAVSKVTKKGTPYREVVVTVQSPLEKCFVTCSTEQVTIRGLLWLPEKVSPPYKLVVFTHGSQGSTPFYPKGVEPDANGLAGEFFTKGYAVMMGYRKGRSFNDLPVPEISADTAESTVCGDSGKSGLRSATSDIVAYLDVLRTRKDINPTKIILMGNSRGGVISLSVASKEYPGVAGVITISAGWVSEYGLWGSGANSMRCDQGYNDFFFKDFGEKLKVPVLALYGGKDPLHSADTYRKHISYLGKHAPVDYLIVDDADHRAFLGSARGVWEEKQDRFLRLIDP
jgi:dienelactone hydrolase